MFILRCKFDKQLARYYSENDSSIGYYDIFKFKAKMVEDFKDLVNYLLPGVAVDARLKFFYREGDREIYYDM